MITNNKEMKSAIPVINNAKRALLVKDTVTDDLGTASLVELWLTLGGTIGF